MENDEHVDFKDIRLMFECIRKQNVNFIEILFTPYCIINPLYTDLFQSVLDAREDIARYNNYAGMSCLLGMALEKQHAMEHPYPAALAKIEQFGYDPKQLHHALRMREFMTRYMAGENYFDCLVSKQSDYLVEIKRGCHTLEEARQLMQEAVDSMIADKKQIAPVASKLVNSTGLLSIVFIPRSGRKQNRLRRLSDTAFSNRAIFQILRWNLPGSKKKHYHHLRRLSRKSSGRQQGNLSKMMATCLVSAHSKNYGGFCNGNI